MRKATIFNDAKKHAEFLEHIKDTHHREIEHLIEREERCGNENYCLKVINKTMALL